MANEAEVKLITTRFSTFGQRVQLALSEKGIPFELILVDLINKPKQLLDANPIHRKVPVIIHKGTPVVESLVILQYLEDAWPETVPLMPEGAVEKSKVRFWTDYIYKGFSQMVDAFRQQPGTPEKQASIEGVSKFWKTLDETMTKFSADGPFFTGDKFGSLDVALGPLACSTLLAERATGVPFPGQSEVPRLRKWIEAMKAHPSVRSTLPSDEENLDLITDISRRARAAREAAAAAAAATPP